MKLKNFIFLASIFVAFTSNAGQIQWAVVASSSPLFGPNADLSTSGVRLGDATIFYFIDNGSSVWTTDMFLTAMSNGDYSGFSSIFLGQGTTNPAGGTSTVTITDDRLTTGTSMSFFAVAIYDSTLTTASSTDGYWFNISTTATATPTDFPSTPGDGSIRGGWTGWQAIPEPATAGLALAGLALLFRRKRK